MKVGAHLVTDHAKQCLYVEDVARKRVQIMDMETLKITPTNLPPEVYELTILNEDTLVGRMSRHL